MNRADFWCRVLAWLQIGGAVAFSVVIYVFWSVMFGWIAIGPGSGALTVLKWVVIAVLMLPPFMSGILTLFFADEVQQSQEGLRAQPCGGLRACLMLAGLWSAGIIGFVGLSLPPISFFAVLGLASAAIAIIGQDWTADLFLKRKSLR